MPNAADSGSAAGPGAGSPNSRTRSRQARKASFPVTTCSMQAGASASNTASVRPTRKCPNRRSASTSGECSASGLKPPGSSASPTNLGELIECPLGPLTPRPRGHLVAVADDLDQDWTGRRAGGAQPDVTESAVRRVAAAAAMQPENRRQQHRSVESQLPGGPVHRDAGLLDQEPLAVGGGESVVQQDFPRRRVVPLDVGQHLFGPGEPRHLDDQGTGPSGQTATAPSGHHGISDLDAAAGRRSVEADVTHHLIIDDELMNPPVGLARQDPPGLVTGEQHAECMEGVGERILRDASAAWVLADGLASRISRASVSGTGRSRSRSAAESAATPNHCRTAATDSSGNRRVPWSAASSPAPAYRDSGTPHADNRASARTRGSPDSVDSRRHRIRTSRRPASTASH